METIANITTNNITNTFNQNAITFTNQYADFNYDYNFIQNIEQEFSTRD